MKYVVIGSSAAGVNAIRELRRLDKECQIVLISKDKDIYSRCILHEYLAGKRTIERRSRGCVSSRKILKRSIKSTG